MSDKLDRVRALRAKGVDMMKARRIVERNDIIEEIHLADSLSAIRKILLKLFPKLGDE